MSKAFIVQKHAELAEVEAIASEAAQKVLGSGVDMKMALILTLHHAVIKPSLKYLSPEENAQLHEYAEGWIEQYRELGITDSDEREAIN